MSYIRSGSNPEALYIYSSGDNRLVIHYGAYPNDQTFNMPVDIFEGLLRRSRESYGGEAEYKDAKVTEDVWVEKLGLHKYKETDVELREIMTCRKDKYYLFTKVSYDDWEFFVWPVTWSYLCYGR